jgi:hypothetical protein
VAGGSGSVQSTMWKHNKPAAVSPHRLKVSMARSRSFQFAASNMSGIIEMTLQNLVFAKERLPTMDKSVAYTSL